MSPRKSSDLPELAGTAEDPFAAGAAILDRELEAFLFQINQRMGWIYPVEFSHIPMGAYRCMVQLCILDRAAANLTLEERAQRAQLAAPAAEQIRATPAFQEVLHAFGESWEQVALPKTLAEHIGDPMVQHKIAQRTLRLALHAGDLKVSAKALEQVSDRAMPVQAQKAEARILMLTPEVAALIAETMRMTEPKPVGELPPPADG